MDSRSVVSLTTECILHFRAGRASVSVKHPQEAAGLQRRPGIEGTGKPTKDVMICSSVMFSESFQSVFTFAFTRFLK